jgi:CRP/FNR family transcriptional regulator
VLIESSIESFNWHVNDLSRKRLIGMYNLKRGKPVKIRGNMSHDNALQNKARLLKAVSYFSNLDDAALHLVAISAIRHVYDAGQVILLEGEPCAGLYIVEGGWLKAVKIGMDGREQVLQTLGPGDVFNAVSVFTDAPNQATVTALETSRVWLVPREVLLRMMDKQPALARQVVKDLAGRVMHLVRLVEDLSLRSVEARLARLILEQADGETLQRRRWATQAEMANRLGTVPDVANRALRKLAEAGMIRVERHQIQILDKDGLMVVAQVAE